eukprot:UN09205
MGNTEATNTEATNTETTKIDQDNKISDDNDAGSDAKEDNSEWEFMEKPDKQETLLNSDLAVGQNYQQISQTTLNSKYKLSTEKATKQDLQNMMLHNLQNKGIKMTVYSNKLDKNESRIFLADSQKIIIIKPEQKQLNQAIHKIHLKDIKHIKLNDGGTFHFYKKEHSLNPNESLWFAMKYRGTGPLFYGFGCNNKDNALLFVQLLNELMSLY